MGVVLVSQSSGAIERGRSASWSYSASSTYIPAFGRLGGPMRNAEQAHALVSLLGPERSGRKQKEDGSSGSGRRAATTPRSPISPRPRHLFRRRGTRSDDPGPRGPGGGGAVREAVCANGHRVGAPSLHGAGRAGASTLVSHNARAVSDEPAPRRLPGIEATEPSLNPERFMPPSSQRLEPPAKAGGPTSGGIRNDAPLVLSHDAFFTRSTFG